MRRHEITFSPVLRRCDSLRAGEHELLFVRACQAIRFLNMKDGRYPSLDPEERARLDRWKNVRDSLYRLLGLSTPVEPAETQEAG